MIIVMVVVVVERWPQRYLIYLQIRQTFRRRGQSSSSDSLVAACRGGLRDPLPLHLPASLSVSLHLRIPVGFICSRVGGVNGRGLRVDKPWAMGINPQPVVGG